MSQQWRPLTKPDVAAIALVALILAAVLFPYIQSARATARRDECKSRLKTLGLALHNYEDTHKTFPPGWIAANKERSGASGFGWGTMLLPFLKSSSLYKGFDLNRNLADPENMQNATSPHSSFRCPADPGNDQVAVLLGLPAISMSNYVANFGVGIPQSDLPTSFCQGMFARNSRVRIRDIRDGVTNVVFLSERIVPMHAKGWKDGELEGSYDSLWAGVPQPGTLSPFSTLFTVTTGDITKIGERESLNIVGDLNGLTGTYESEKVDFFPINRSLSNEPLNSFKNGTFVTAGISSNHSGGAHVLMGDAAVRLVSDKVETKLLINLMRRSDALKGQCAF